jgi:predicted type IV restriction endonuclease
MDFKDQLKQLSDRVAKLKDQIQTEEATKNAFILPFIMSLGYDVFNPNEVVPEYTCDIGIKKGEKIDYAILKDGQPSILIECKHWSENLDLHDGQLLRYFHVSKAKFSILTNGILYRFYTDLEEKNKMDTKPFLEFNILDIKENFVEELKKFHKSYFDVENIFNSASELKYTRELQKIIVAEMQNPTDILVRHFAKQVYTGLISAKILEQFTQLTRKSYAQVINDIITERLKSALNKENEAAKEIKEDVVISAESQESQVVTTVEEMEGFYIVRSILRQKIDIKRIVHRDALTYFAILLDDNNRKPICRLYLNGNKKFISTFDEAKKDTKFEISSLDDIYKYADVLLKTIENYEKIKVN